MEDRINSLPDEVLCHILSLLRIKEAITTSLLVSKRWNPLWRSLPALNFDYDCLPLRKENLKNFVDKVISSRDQNQCIKTFRLRFCIYQLHRYVQDSDVENWINGVVQPGFEQLHLTLGPLMNLPSSVLSCRSLVVLKLHKMTVNTISSVHLPSLKILHLDYVHFSEGRYLEEILSACPVLEDLKIIGSSCASYFAAEAISENSLSTLFRAKISNYFLRLKAVHNVQFLHLKEDRDEEFRYSYDDIPVFQNLTELKFKVVNFSCHKMVEMIKHCPKLQILVIDKWYIDEIDEENWAYPQQVPECLSLHLRTCTFIDYVGDKGEFMFARYIMQKARVLQTMTICSERKKYGDEYLQILKKLSMCSRISPTCQLLFEEWS